MPDQQSQQTVASIPQGDVPQQPAQPIQPIPQATPTPPSTPPPQGENFLLKQALQHKRLVLFLLLAFVLATYFFYVRPRVGNEVVIRDQPVGGSIYIEKIIVRQPAGLVIQAEGEYSQPLYPVAQTPVLEPGFVYSDFNLSYISELTEEAKEKLVPGTRLYATLFKPVGEDGAMSFSSESEPVRDLFGRSVRIKFRLQ